MSLIYINYDSNCILGYTPTNVVCKYIRPDLLFCCFLLQSVKGSKRAAKSSQEIVFSFKLKPNLSRDQAEGRVEMCRDVVVFHKQQISTHSLYEIPPPNYTFDPMLSREKLLWRKNKASWMFDTRLKHVVTLVKEVRVLHSTIKSDKFSNNTVC